MENMKGYLERYNDDGKANWIKRRRNTEWVRALLEKIMAEKYP